MATAFIKDLITNSNKSDTTDTTGTDKKPNSSSSFFKSTPLTSDHYPPPPVPAASATPPAAFFSSSSSPASPSLPFLPSPSSPSSSSYHLSGHLENLRNQHPRDPTSALGLLEPNSAHVVKREHHDLHDQPSIVFPIFPTISSSIGDNHEIDNNHGDNNDPPTDTTRHPSSITAPAPSPPSSPRFSPSIATDPHPHPHPHLHPHPHHPHPPSFNISPRGASIAAVANMNQSNQYGGGAPRRANTYESQHDELHLPPTMSHQGHVSPRGFSNAAGPHSGPHIKLDQPASQSISPGYQGTGASSSSSVPNVLQPGGLSGARPQAMNANTAPILPTMSGAIQQSPTEYAPPQRPTLTTSHSYTRTSPGVSQNYDSSSSYIPYTPTTPGGGASAPGPSQYMSPQDLKYGAPGSQRNIANTPLGLADIRPRADSTLSDGTPGTLGYELSNTQPSASNYLAPWALYAFDWCKWPPQGKGAGKVAIGSYLEDGHNFVGFSFSLFTQSCYPKPKTCH